MYRCCIFDLDGTLLNTLKALTITTNRMLDHFGLGPLDEEHIRNFVGDGYRMLVERALTECGDTGLKHYEEGLFVYTKEFAEHCMDEVCPYDGIREFLEELKRRGIAIAVLSNKPHEKTVENIETVFGAGYFDRVYGERDGINRKPDPAGVLAILRELGIKQEECLYFGDTNTDMRTGKAANVDTVGVTWGFRDREELEEFSPLCVIDHPKEALPLFLSKPD